MEDHQSTACPSLALPNITLARSMNMAVYQYVMTHVLQENLPTQLLLCVAYVDSVLVLCNGKFCRVCAERLASSQQTVQAHTIYAV